MQAKQPTLETVRFLQREGLDKLCQRFTVSKKRHQKFPNLVLFKYDQVRANFSSRIVRECRGLIVNEEANWAIVAWPFMKFFNYGESFAEPIDWESAHVYEKLDGSLCTLYYYQRAWHVSSVGMPDAAGKLPCGLTFAELFWDVWNKLRYQLPKQTDTCYMFELLTERNRIIVPQKQERIVLLGLRHIPTLEEALPEPVAAEHGWECVRRTPIASLADLLKESRCLNPMEGEGWVVCDKQFRRLKIKSPQYVALSYMSERNKNPRVNTRNLVEILRANEGSEFLSYYPEWRAPYEKAKIGFDALVAALESGTPAVKGAIATECSAALKEGTSSSVRAYLASCPIDSLVAALSDLGVADGGGEEGKAAAVASTKAQTPPPAPVEAAAASDEQPSGQSRRKKKQAAPANIFELLGDQ